MGVLQYKLTRRYIDFFFLIKKMEVVVAVIKIMLCSMKDEVNVMIFFTIQYIVCSRHVCIKTCVCVCKIT